MGHKRLRVGTTTQELLATGKAALDDWDDEELARGQKRNKLGRFSGRAPKVIPLFVLQELNRRVSSWGQAKMTASVKEAVQYISDCCAGRVEADRDRLHACEIVLNRVWGREPQRLELVEETDPYQKNQGARRVVVLREVIDVESEEYVNPFEEDSED